MLPTADAEGKIGEIGEPEVNLTGTKAQRQLGSLRQDILPSKSAFKAKEKIFLQSLLVFTIRASIQKKLYKEARVWLGVAISSPPKPDSASIPKYLSPNDRALSILQSHQAS